MIYRKSFSYPEQLAAHLLELLEHPNGLSWLEPEHLIVPSMDYAHWLKTEIGRRSSKRVAANLQWYQPIDFIDRFSRELTAEHHREEQTEWTKATMQWGLYRLMPELREDPEFEQMPRIEEGGPRENLKWYRLAGHIADTFEKYMIYRPDWLARWQVDPERGLDLPENEDYRWQPHLWYRLCERFPKFEDRARRMEKARRQMKSAVRLNSFPSRFILAGVPTLPESAARWFETLQTVENVAMHVLEWTPFALDTPQEKDCKAPSGPKKRLSRRAADIRSNWNKQRTEFRELKDKFWDNTENSTGRESPRGSKNTNLSLLQTVLQNPGLIKKVPQFKERESPATLQFHSAHSPQREVEVLHEQLLECFEDDPTLRPDDILIVSPDMERYAPPLNAVLDQPGDDDLRIPFHRFEVGGRYRNRLVELLIDILDTARGRFKVTRVLDILSHPVIRRSLDLDLTDLERIEAWLLDLRVRWGYDGNHRKRVLRESNERTQSRSVSEEDYHPRETEERGNRDGKEGPQSPPAAGDAGPLTEQNSWQWAMDRLWFGLSSRSGEGTFVHGRLPYNAVEGSDDSRRLGALQRLIRSLWQLHEFVRQEHALSRWSRRLSALIRDWFTVDWQREPDLQWLLKEVNDLDEFEEQANGDAVPASVDILIDLLEQQVHQQRHPVVRMAGRAVVAPMVPLRGIPFKVIAIVGANYESLPKPDPANPFDMTLENPRKGDRSRRMEDRQLMLDYLLSAEDKLLITYTGRDQRDDEEQPPSPLVTELLDLLGHEGAEDDEGSKWIREHPLHGFEARSAENTTFLSARNRQSRRAFSEKRKGDRAISDLAAIDQPIDGQSRKSRFPLTLSIRELQRFYAHPVRYYCQQSLGLYLREEELVDTDEEPYEIGGLDSYLIYNEILKQMLLENAWEPDLNVYRERGILPHGAIGRHAWRGVLRELQGQGECILGDVGLKTLSQPDSIELQLDIDGHEAILQGETGLNAGKLQCEYKTGGSLKPKNRIEGWITHVAANAAGFELDTGLWGRESGRKSFKMQQRFPAEDPDRARQILTQLVRGWLIGAARPLAFLPKSSYKWADTYFDEEGAPAGDPDEALQEAADAYHDEHAYRAYYNESHDSYYRYFFRDVNPWKNDEAESGEAGATARKKLQQTARRIWKPYWEGCQ